MRGRSVMRVMRIGLLVVGHDGFGTVLVGKHVDAGARGQREEHEQLARACGREQELLGIRSSDR